MARVTPQYVSEQMPLDYAPLQNTREVAVSNVNVCLIFCFFLQFFFHFFRHFLRYRRVILS